MFSSSGRSYPSIFYFYGRAKVFSDITEKCPDSFRDSSELRWLGVARIGCVDERVVDILQWGMNESALAVFALRSGSRSFRHVLFHVPFNLLFFLFYFILFFFFHFSNRFKKYCISSSRRTMVLVSALKPPLIELTLGNYLWLADCKSTVIATRLFVSLGAWPGIGFWEPSVSIGGEGHHPGSVWQG